MTTPAQEAKQYAEQHGFKIEAIGRRYKVTNVATGATFERGGYPAVLNAMEQIALYEVDAIEATREAGCACAPYGDGSGAKCPDPITGRLGCERTENTSQAFDTKPASEILADMKAAANKALLGFQQLGRALTIKVATMRQRYPWNVYVDGAHVYSEANRGDAVKRVRNLLSNGATFKTSRITIDYVPF